MTEAWRFEAGLLWILLVGGALMYIGYQSAACEKARCPAGTKTHYFVSSYNASCVCEPAGWRK